MTVAEYLEFEKTGEVRHEYLDGEIYEMTGASRRHNLIAIALLTQLKSRLRGGSCQVYVVDVKVYIEPLNVFYYPDIVVACDPQDNDDYFVRNPLLIAEVESPSTSSIDRREKLMAYRKLPCLREYLLLSQTSTSAEVFRRDDDGERSLEQVTGDQELRLDSVDLSLPLRVLYET